MKSSPPQEDATQLLQTIREIVESASAAQRDINPPAHIMVTCGDDKVAFGRTALIQMGYDKALDAFLDEFATPEDMEASMFATFWRGGDEGPVRIHRGSWVELLVNVKQINVVVEGFS